MISIVILTKNEEQDLPYCLEAISWCNDIHVLDSGSTDRTLLIAKRFGATVSYNEFRSFGHQRNYALDHLDLKHAWVLFLDADEVATDGFREEVQNCVQNAGESVAGYYCCWKMMLENRWLKRCDSYPKWQFRLMKKGWARFTDFGHGQKECDIKGDIHYIKEPYLHYGFSKGWTHWLARHNHYASDEAVARLTEKRPLVDCFSLVSSKRNSAIKIWIGRLPGWPILRFIHAYVLKRGFLEGVPALIYCTNMMYYEFLIQIKMREICRNSVSAN